MFFMFQIAHDHEDRSMGLSKIVYLLARIISLIYFIVQIPPQATSTTTERSNFWMGVFKETIKSWH